MKAIQDFYEACPFPGYDPGFTLFDLEANAKLFAKLLRSQAIGPILEVGCGTGQLSCYLSLEHQVTGVDACEASLALANRFKEQNLLNNVTFVKSDLFHLPFENKFPLVICNGVLHCTENARLGFHAIADFVSPGGFIVIGLYNRYGRLPFYAKKWLVLKGLWPFSIPLSTPTQLAWFKDQYLIPFETTHTMGEVRGWFAEAGFDFIRSVPSTMTGRIVPANLFEKVSSSDWRVQLGMFLRGESFFFMVGRKSGKRCCHCSHFLQQ